MFRFASLIAAGALAVWTLPASAESYTTRIEPRQFYGATVTLEEGVRVFRPLPVTRQVIINPNNTPLALSFHDVRVTEERTINNVMPTAPGASPSAPTYFSPFYLRGYHGGANHSAGFGHQGGVPVGGGRR